MSPVSLPASLIIRRQPLSRCPCNEQCQVIEARFRGSVGSRCRSANTWCTPCVGTLSEVTQYHAVRCASDSLLITRTSTPWPSELPRLFPRRCSIYRDQLHRQTSRFCTLPATNYRFHFRLKWDGSLNSGGSIEISIASVIPKVKWEYR